MPSEIFCTLELDPFYQAFLRARFQVPEGEPFRFSKGHDLSLFFQALLRPAPPHFMEPDFGEDSFLIEIPFIEHKNPATYRYVSPERMVMFSSRVMRYWKMVAHDIITQARRMGMEKKVLPAGGTGYPPAVFRPGGKGLLPLPGRREDETFPDENKKLKNVKKMSDKRLNSI
jgi:hypothetical protein